MTRPRRLLVTGAGGFVGAAVCRAAVEAGHEVVALVRNDRSRLAAIAGKIDLRRADLSDFASVHTLLRDTSPDVVIHSAWEGVGGALRAGDIQLENIRTTVSLADAAIAAGARKFVGIGSQAEYGRYERRVVESDLPQPHLLYGAAKLSAFHLVRQKAAEKGMAFARLRLFAAYGPGDNANWLIPRAARSLLAGAAPSCTPGTQLWDYLHIDDVASGVLAAATSDAATGAINLSSGQPESVRSIIERLRDLAAPGLALRFGDVPFGPNQIMHLEGDNSRLRETTGWQPRVALSEGLTGLVAELRAAA